MLPNSVLRPSCTMSGYLQEDREVSNFNLPLDCNNNSVPSNSMSMTPYTMPQFRQDREGSNCNQAMDFHSNSVSSNVVSNSMLVPSCPILHYHQEKDRERRNTFNLPLEFNSNSASTNVSNSSSMPSYPVPQYRPQNIQQEGKLRSFWEKQLMDIQAAEAFKSQHKLPLARIRRIMKTDADVQVYSSDSATYSMVSAETPMLMSKACEIFIQELTYRAWMRAEESNKSTVQPCDVAKVIMQNHAMQFLTDIVPDNLQNFCAYGAQEERTAGNIAEGRHPSQATLPDTAGFMGNPMNVMNMGRVRLGGRKPADSSTQQHDAASLCYAFRSISLQFSSQVNLGMHYGEMNEVMVCSRTMSSLEELEQQFTLLILLKQLLNLFSVLGNIILLKYLTSSCLNIQ
ncbi:Nuclear transcription factor Y subunit [Vigna angularis]|uniref:Nuclear transcription factor Y subunit n=1 Tax=Phaseolus angularis TaxID=3914 RepID=A0A8T0KV22_PHAAN|nr:Nuclear transcription factor Y subunit [Vigna angularis]